LLQDVIIELSKKRFYEFEGGHETTLWHTSYMAQINFFQICIEFKRDTNFTHEIVCGFNP
jgi:hypothetical protein